MLDIQAIATALGLEMTKALPGLHAFTGSDCTSAFVRKGKKGPFKTLEHHPEFFTLFQSIGSSSTHVTETTLNDMQHFVCCMYGKPVYDDVNKLRCDIFKSRYEEKSPQQSFVTHDGIDLSLIPPCKASLRMHYLRVNYQTLIWKQSHVAYANIPSPVGHGWELDAEGNLVVDWIDGDVMPQKLVDVLASKDTGHATNHSDEDEEQSEEVEEEYEVDNILDIIFEDDKDEK